MKIWTRERRKKPVTRVEPEQLGSYGVNITLISGDDDYSVDHELLSLPEPATTKALLDEAVDAFSLLFGELPTEHSVTVAHVPPGGSDEWEL